METIKKLLHTVGLKGLNPIKRLGSQKEGCGTKGNQTRKHESPNELKR